MAEKATELVHTAMAKEIRNIEIKSTHSPVWPGESDIFNQATSDTANIIYRQGYHLLALKQQCNHKHQEEQ